ncbi:MAG: 4Fe-4S dicluster domain-containing protein [Syntrophomonadaceae bacterium]
MKYFKKGQIEKIVDRLAEKADVFVPMLRGQQSGFFSWKSYDENYDDLIFDLLNVYSPPKNIVLPQTEKMYNFDQQGQEVIVKPEEIPVEPKVIFGIRSCDVKAIEYLDEVFLTRTFVDEFYKARRDQVTIVANACYNPGTNCFCKSMGVDPLEPEMADVILREVENGYVWEPKTEKGDILTKQIEDLLEEKEVELYELNRFVRKVNYDGVAEKLKDLFDHPMWERYSDPCQTCGICTYMCPTCYCFDVQVKNWGEEGYRFRCWDSCMYREYTQMAGGHNPREATTERFRNRFLHKLQFFNERYGTPLCTGCGRCIVACPAGVDIIRMIELIKEAEPSV